MSNESQEQIEPSSEPVTSDDLDQLSELDAILNEATELDGGVIGQDGEVVEYDDSPQIETSELLYPIIDMGFEIIKPHWKVKSKEKKALAEAYGSLLDKYFPDAGEYFGVEITALLATGMVCMPRMTKQEKPASEPKSKPKDIEHEPEPLEQKPVYRKTVQETEGFKFD